MSNEDPALKPSLRNQARLFQKAKASPVGAEGKMRVEETIDPVLFHRGALNAGKDGVPDYSCWDDAGYKRDMHKRGVTCLVPQPASRPTFGYSHVPSANWPFKPRSSCLGVRVS